MTGWTADDIRVASALEAQFPSVHVVDVIIHEENSMTETVMDGPVAEDSGWEPEGDDQSPTYPELPSNPHNHVYTWSPKLPDGSMLVIRSQTADGLVEAVEAMAPLAGRLKAAWQGVLGTPQPAPQAPQYQAGAGAGANFNPQTPPPNQPYAGQPAWQQGGAPQAQAAPQWGGGAPQGQQPGERKQYPAPQGWFKLNVPFPGGTDQLHAVAQGAGIPKGQPAKGGMYNFWGLTPGGQPGKAWYCAPQVAQAFAQFTPMPA